MHKRSSLCILRPRSSQPTGTDLSVFVNLPTYPQEVFFMNPMHLNACEPHPKTMWHPPFTGIRLPDAVRVWIGRGLEQAAAAVQRLLGPMRSACGPSVDAQTPSWPASASVARLWQGCGCPIRLLCRMRSTQNRLIG